MMNVYLFIGNLKLFSYMIYSASRLLQKTFFVLFFLASFMIILSQQNSSYAVYCRRDTDCAAGETCSSINQCTSPTVSTPTPTPFIPTVTPRTSVSTPTPTSQFCAQIMTSARNTSTRECQVFSTSCLPAGWIADSSCSSTASTPTSIPTSGTYCRTNLDCNPSSTCVNNACTVSVSTPTPTPGCVLNSSGDANCDGVIDLLDFNIWRTEFLGLSASSPTSPTITPPQADFNKDGAVNILDFNIWRDSFLNLVPTSTVPSPTGTIRNTTPILSPISSTIQICTYKTVNCLNGQNYCVEGSCGTCDRNGGVTICINVTPTPVIPR